MPPAPLPLDEEARLVELGKLGILDSAPNIKFDAIVQAAALACGTPISLISILDRNRQWFKANYGFGDVLETPRDYAFCGYTLAGADLLEVPNTTLDPRFADNPLVTNPPYFRFYAGVSLAGPSGHYVGTLCVIDTVAKVLTDAQRDILRSLRVVAESAVESFALRYQHQQGEEALRRLHERMTLATEAAGIGIWDFKVATNTTIRNETMNRLYGREFEVTQGEQDAWLASIHPEDRGVVEQAIADATAGHKPYSCEFRIVRPDASVRYIQAVARPIDTGQHAGDWVGINWDVTDVRMLAAQRDEQAAMLAESEANFRLIAENAKDMISWVGADGARLYVSPASEYLFGMSPQDMINFGPLSRVHPDDLPQVMALQDRLLAGTTQEERLTFRINHPTRGEIWVESSAQCLSRSRPELAVGYISVLREITDQVHLQQEREKRAIELQAVNAELELMARHLVKARDAADRASRAKSRFLAGMSHELRTPLNGILGYAQLLRLEGSLNEVQTGRVNAMLDAGAHLLEIISSVLDLSEIESEHVELHPTETDSVAIARVSLDLVRPRAEARGLRLSLEVSPGHIPTLTTDPTRLRQILLNFLGNAVKFTESGAVQLRLRPCADRAAIRFEVADTGPGIEPELKSRLFQDFQRLAPVDVAEQAAPEGAGLGLALSQRLAMLLGGSLGCDDNPGGGSVFWLELPLSLSADASARVAGPGIEQPTIAETTGQGLRVLVADDAPMNRDIACAMLKLAGHTPTSVSGGAEAVAAASEADFDVILMDVRMPEIDGLEATRRIRALGGQRSTVPIIGLTALVFAEQVALCMEAGMDGHLAKPYNQEALLNAVRTASEAAAQRQREARPTAKAPPSAPNLRDAAVATQLSQTLPPQAVSAYLKTMAARCEALLQILRQPDMLAQEPARLAGEAHKIAGSAGLLGYATLASQAVAFERAVVANQPELPALSQALACAAEETIADITASHAA